MNDRSSSPSGAAPSRRLVLASRGVPFDLREFVPGPRVAVISNAADCYGAEGRARKGAKDAAALQARGLDVVGELDLRRVPPSRVADAVDWLARVDAIWVGGGNTFWLLHQLRRSGVAAHLEDLLAGGPVWVGESAGSVVCAPSLAGVDLEDDPSASPDPEAAGLGLVPFLPWAHWSSRTALHPDRHSRLPGVKTPLYRLRDSEYLLVDSPADGRLTCELRDATADLSLFPVG